VRKMPPPAPSHLDRLESTIRRLLDAYEVLLARAAAAEARVGELETALRDLAAGRIDPVALAEEVRSLEQRNARLQDRVTRARAAVDRMAGRLQFTTEER
jgi:predicted RNase H-like nuclease (RuvC/YqgF family)